LLETFVVTEDQDRSNDHRNGHQHDEHQRVERARAEPTRQRDAVLQVLNDLDGFHSAQELHQVLRERGLRVGLSTVYRSLQLLADDRDIDVIHAGGPEALYRRCSTRRRHHHLVCRTCHTAVEVTDSDLASWIAQVSTQHGFIDVDPTVEVLGTCSKCAGTGQQ
jgi:Fur family transcriptional regulator, ferric uptake regulator